MARPTKEPTPEQRTQVRAWVKAKISLAEMARRLGLAPKTFRKHFMAELGADRAETVITPSPSPHHEPLRPTDDQREMVLALAGAHWPNEDIALYLGISLEALEEHFAAELRDGPVRFTAPVIRAMWHAAQGGNATAAKIILIMGATSRPAKDAALQPAANGMIGKKAQAAIAAQNAEQDTAWANLIDPSDKPN